MEVKNDDDFFKGKKSAKNLILADERDRPYLIGRIKDSSSGEFFYYGEEHSFSDLMNEVFQASLFSPSKVFIILHSDQYTDEQWKTLLDEREAVIYVFKKTIKKPLLTKFQKEGIVLNLLDEKPWDRKNRLVSKVVYSMHESGVSISQPTAYRFVERVFVDLHLFTAELLKLKIYAIGKKSLEDADIDAIVKPLVEENAFKVAEEIIWKREATSNFVVDSTSALLQVLGAFRFQAYLGLKITSSEGVSLPLWQMKKYKQKAEEFGSDYFKQMLVTLFKIEERAKQTSISARALYDLLVIEILSSKVHL